MMPTSWHDVISRVRGLASRLVGRAALERLSTSRDLRGFVSGLETTTYASLANVTALTGRTLEREARRVAGRNAGIIALWCGDRVDALAPLFEDEDRRNLRSLARGIMAHEGADQRLAGLLPTPALPNAALEELSHSVRLADLAATLSAWGNPYGRAMMPEAARETPNLFALQLALDREYAARALSMAPRAGDAIVRYVRLVIDGENVSTALAVAAGTVEHDPATLFIAGGDLMSAGQFAELVGLGLTDLRERLAPMLAATPLAPLANAMPQTHETATLTALLRELHRTVRRNPLTTEVILEYLLRLRAELHDLALIIWGIALHVPRGRVTEHFATP
jgi:vacuolar-type H+-ATPase subunit C/Vma6